jgi:hypothetical protein
VYAIAEGDALKSNVLLKELKDIAESTGAQFHEGAASVTWCPSLLRSATVNR